MTINFNFNKDIENFLKIISKNAQNQNVRVFFVGGIVRDALLNKEIKDIDLIIEGNAIELSKTLPDEIIIKSIHKDFGTVKLQYKEFEIDIASTREEKYPYSGCLPEITKIGVPIECDVKRRDFTINSLYSQITLENDVLNYKLIDLVNGKEDLDKKILKVLHKKSYIDDPTRILRGINFKYRFDLEFSKDDISLIKNYLNNIDYDNMSHDRILSVFKHILSNEFSDKIFKELLEKKYYKIIQNNNLNINIEKINEIINLFTLNNEEKRDFYMQILQNKTSEKQTFVNEIQGIKYFKKETLDSIAYYYLKHKDKAALNYLNKKEIAIITKGSDLLKLNYPKGKIIGEILEKLYIEKLKNKDLFPTKEKEIDWIKKSFPNK